MRMELPTGQNKIPTKARITHETPNIFRISHKQESQSRLLKKAKIAKLVDKVKKGDHRNAIIAGGG